MGVLLVTPEFKDLKIKNFIFLSNTTTHKRNNYYRLYHLTLRKKCSYLELFWSVFSRIRTEYGEIRNIPPYSVRMRKNTEQNNSEHRHYLHSAKQN